MPFNPRDPPSFVVEARYFPWPEAEYDERYKTALWLARFKEYLQVPDMMDKDVLKGVISRKVCDLREVCPLVHGKMMVQIEEELGAGDPTFLLPGACLVATSPLAASKTKERVVEELNGEKFWNWGWKVPQMVRNFGRRLTVVPWYDGKEKVVYTPTKVTSEPHPG